MFKFKYELSSTLGIHVRVVENFEPFQFRINLDNRIIGFGHQMTKLTCDFGPNSQEKFMKIISNNQVRTLKNRVRSHKISISMFQKSHHITYSDNQVRTSDN